MMLGINKSMKLAKKLFTELISPLKLGNRFDIELVVVFVLINGLVIFNACLHDPRIGYDADGHLSYIQTFSQFCLVTPQDSHEFFSPPLPYVIPSLLIAITGMNVFCAAKLAQLTNVFLSIGLTLYLIKACKLISSRSSLNRGALAFLGIFPVYYKTFAYVRGEPYVVFFAVAMLYYTLLMVIREQFTSLNTIILGVTMGLCALSRQWGILLLPAVFLFLGFQWIRLPQLRYPIAKAICLCLLLITVISGWFYISLYSRYGSITAFNRKPTTNFSLTNQPLKFYVGLSPKMLFSNTVRPNFPNQFLPIFYSELWGDYWGYFIVNGRDTNNAEFVSGHTLNRLFSEDNPPHWLESNYNTVGAYLGRVNLISIFPSVLALISLVIAAKGMLQKNINDPLIAHQRGIYAFLLLEIIISMVGYFWFCIRYPNPENGDTIKATYMLQVFPFVAILVAIYLEKIEKRSHFLYQLIIGGLCCCFIHNIIAMLTHYNLYLLL
jgi:hypothetical protein